MVNIRVNKLKVKNYRSFGNEEQIFEFPWEDYKKPIAIIWYNNVWKTNLINSIKYWLYESVKEDTFDTKDFFNLDLENSPYFKLEFKSSWLWDDKIIDNINYFNEINIEVENKKIKSVKDICSCYWNNSKYSKKWIIKQNSPIFYINFHKIKEEISTKKTSWGNLTSFLWKHINKLVESDEIMKSRKELFKNEITISTKKVLEWEKKEWETQVKSKLFDFIEKIKLNYSQNLRNNSCFIEFTLPDYEDIFLQMMFKVGLNWKENNLVPIEHFWDWYISMFVMAVIQTIAESNIEDKCLFLFEEPESFLHENHQEYFYKTVLCGLSDKWHQVIYTTHSDRMIDIFDTRWLIRLEFDEKKWTTKTYNDIKEFSPVIYIPKEDNEEEQEELSKEVYNEYIKTIEPNLNKILFSKKVILVEGPNDLMSYKYAIEKKIDNKIKDNSEILNKKRYCETYLNFHNIVIIPHHWKYTALLLIQLCKHIWVEFFVINDWDFDEDFIENLSSFSKEEDYKNDNLYTSSDKTRKWMITVNWKLIQESKDKDWKSIIHFNVPKLEKVIWYDKDDKNAVKIWRKLKEIQDFNDKFFPKSLEDFLGIWEKTSEKVLKSKIDEEINIEDIPF